MNRRRVVALVLAGAALSAACGGEGRVGSERLLRFREKERERLGQIQRPTPPPTGAPTPPPTPSPTPRPQAQPTPQPQLPTVTVEITAQGFKPFNFRVFKGTTIRVVNTDNQPRTFTSDQPGVFDSGAIPPGGSWTWVANVVGTFNFHDETRPFVVGQLEVVPR